RGYAHSAHAGAGTPGERDRRTMDRNCPPRTTGPDTDHQPPPSHRSADRVRDALQPAPPTPRAQPSNTAEVTTTPGIAIPNSPATSRSARWVDTRIHPGRMTWMTNSAPTGLLNEYERAA